MGSADAINIFFLNKKNIKYQKYTFKKRLWAILEVSGNHLIPTSLKSIEINLKLIFQLNNFLLWLWI